MELKVSRSSDEWDSKSAMKAEIGEQRAQRRSETQSANETERSRAKKALFGHRERLVNAQWAD